MKEENERKAKVKISGIIISISNGINESIRRNGIGAVMAYENNEGNEEKWLAIKNDINNGVA